MSTRTEIINAAPMAILLGAKDSSTRQVAMEPEARPTHLPLTFIFAEKGPEGGVLAGGQAREIIFGTESFNERSIYAKHHLVASNAATRAGNASQMYVRLRPTDAKDPATLRIWADVLETEIEQVERNPETGAILYDADGKSTPTGSTKPGYKVMFIAEEVPAHPVTGEAGFGQGAEIRGSQLSEDGTIQSRRFPILDLEVAHFGAYGNNMGFRLYAPTTKSATPIDLGSLEEGRFYPYRFAALARNDEYSLPTIVETLFAERSIAASFKEDALNKRTDEDMFVEDRFIEAYQLLDDPALPDQHGPFGRMRVYTREIDTLLEMAYEAEFAELPEMFSDFTGEEGEEHRFNFIGGTTSTGVEYLTYQIIDGEGSSRLTENTTLFAKGGTNGTMSDEMFDTLVGQYMEKYLDPNNEVQDTATRVESVLYDTGFSLETKYKLAYFISVRKNTNVFITPMEYGQPVLTASEESSLAISLRTRLTMFPESEYFGTPTARAHIMGRSGRYLNSKFKGDLPLTIELCEKFASYMGAGSGFWNGSYNPEGARNGGSIVNNFAKINVTFTPASIRNKDWDNGLMWVQSYDTKRTFIPAYKSVYDNDTSIFTSTINNFILAELQTVAEHSWRNHTGVTKMTDDELCQSIDDEIRRNVAGRFDSRVRIIPVSEITGRDEQRGFSWTTRIELYSNVMKTVGTMFIEGFRMSDLAGDEGTTA